MGKDQVGVADSYTDGSEDLCGLCNTDGDLLWVKHCYCCSLITYAYDIITGSLSAEVFSHSCGNWFPTDSSFLIVGSLLIFVDI